MSVLVSRRNRAEPLQPMALNLYMPCCLAPPTGGLQMEEVCPVCFSSSSPLPLSLEERLIFLFILFHGLQRKNLAFYPLESAHIIHDSNRLVCVEGFNIPCNVTFHFKDNSPVRISHRYNCVPRRTKKATIVASSNSLNIGNHMLLHHLQFSLLLWVGDHRRMTLTMLRNLGLSTW